MDKQFMVEWTEKVNGREMQLSELCVSEEDFVSFTARLIDSPAVRGITARLATAHEIEWSAPLV